MWHKLYFYQVKRKRETMKRTTESIGYGQLRTTVRKNGVLKVVTLKRGVGNKWELVVEKFVKNAGFGCTLVESYTSDFLCGSGDGGIGFVCEIN